MCRNAPSAGFKYLSFYVLKYYIKFERLTKLNNNVYKKITIILIDFYIEL